MQCEHYLLTKCNLRYKSFETKLSQLNFMNDGLLEFDVQLLSDLLMNIYLHIKLEIEWQNKILYQIQLRVHK